MPKVSVIIPVYNVEPYLRECLDSVVNQTLEDIEIICVDDCSTDRSLMILQEYAERDSRIIMLQNSENSGQSIARNKGIEIAKGEYIQFVDADDYIVPNMLEELYRIAVIHNLDVLRSHLRFEKQSEQEVKKYSADLAGKIFTGQKLFYELEKQQFWERGPCTVFLKTEFLQSKHIRFFPGITNEDDIFGLEIYIYAEKSMCTNVVGYIYRVRPGSTVTAPLSPKRIWSYTVALEQLIKILNQHQCEFQFCLAVMSAFCKTWATRHDHVKEMHQLADLSVWEKDTIETYRTLYYYLDHYQFILQHYDCIKEKKVHIYGAGVVAKKLVWALDACDIAVDSVFVTDNSRGKRTFLGHKVCAIDEAVINADQDVVFIATSERYQEEMQQKLRQMNICNIIPFSFRH